jgi:maltose 6'-phosphate phosphatase
VGVATTESTRLRVLTLNLHCWQETDAEAKLLRVADAVAELRPDVVCLQEVGQHIAAPIIGERHGEIIRADNAALVIIEHLQRDHGIELDWTWTFVHQGFEGWDEGLAILTPGRLERIEAPYVSALDSPQYWNSRRLLMAGVQLASGAYITTASAHFSWWDDPTEPFAPQFDRANAALAARHDPVVFAGDFNIRDDGLGYALVTQDGTWLDAHAAAAAPEQPSGTFPGEIDGWSGADAGRIDYVFARGSQLTPRAARTLFTKAATRVSDHFGVLIDFDLSV